MIALAYFFGLGLLLVFTHGHYSANHLLALLALQTAFTLVALRKPPAALAGGSRNEVLAALLLGFSLFLISGDQLIYPAEAGAHATLRRTLVALPLLVMVAFAGLSFLKKRLGKGALAAGLVGMLLVLVAARVLVLYASPRPFIDVFTSSVQAVNYLLAGKNPYEQSYLDIYAGRYDYKPSFPYLPGYLLWASGWAALFRGAHDVRASLLLAELLAAGCLFGMMRRLRVELSTAGLAVVLWLSFPISLFVLEQAWIDTLLLMAFAGAAWALAARKWALSGALLGLACGTKQYAFVGALFALVFVWRNGGRRAALGSLSAAAGVVALLFAPFALANLGRFYAFTVGVASGLLPRTDALTLMAFLGDKLHLPPEALAGRLSLPFTLLSLLVLGGLLFWLGRKKAPSLGELFVALSACYGWLLLLAKQAFCNYYHFLAFFLLAAACSGWGTAEEQKERAA